MRIAPGLTAEVTDYFLTNLPKILAYKEYIEFVWSEFSYDLYPDVGNRTQDLIDLYFIASMVLSGRFDCVVEVGRSWGLVTSMICGLKSRDMEFYSICPDRDFLRKTLPALKSSRYGKDLILERCHIIESKLEEYPLLRQLRGYRSALLLFDAEHSDRFANYYLHFIVMPLMGQDVLIGIHDIFAPEIQKLARPTPWDDPRGPFFVDDLACLWSEILPVIAFISANGLPYFQTAMFFRQERKRIENSEYLCDLLNVRIPPYSEQWPFDGFAGSWLFFGCDSTPKTSSLTYGLMLLREALAVTLTNQRHDLWRAARRLYSYGKSMMRYFQKKASMRLL